MPDILKLAAACIAGYLGGSVPTGYLIVKALKGVDIRKVGSGNVGATNASRVLGKIPGIGVLILDLLKGALPVLLLPIVLRPEGVAITDSLFKILIGTSAIAGHIWTVFLDFKGGKGVATATGVILVLSPQILLVAFMIWCLLFFTSRYVSLASIAAALSLPVLAIVARKPVELVVFFIVIAAVGIYKHRSNIDRLMKGQESKI